ncbi:MAG: DNA photolyase [Calditrichaeota bacterium]|nr:MAG: DNA photolyase [Calditrichota bacterium]
MRFKKIFVSEQSAEDAVTRRVLDYFPNVPVAWVSDEAALVHQLAALSLTEGKRYLWLTRHRGAFIKYCPGATNTAEHYRCCNYLVINEAAGCPIECNYCFLQAYVNNPAITVYTNVEDIEAELLALSQANPGRILRVGTGELADSLALDPVVRVAETLASAVEKTPNILLEFKTKSDHVDHLLALKPGNFVVSWSLNPEWIVQHAEHKSAPLEQRLQAMKRLSDAGFLLGIHFDPIVYYPEWESGYRELIQRIAGHVAADRIAWISLGSFRTPQGLKEQVRVRFPKSPVLIGEQVRTPDGKLRYIKPLRRRMYERVVSWIGRHLGEVFIYFCAESADLWESVLGLQPADADEVDFLFARNLHRRFPELGLPEPALDIYRQPIRVSPQQEEKTLQPGGQPVKLLF